MKSGPLNLLMMKPLSDCLGKKLATSSRKLFREPINMGKGRPISELYRALYRASSV